MTNEALMSRTSLLQAAVAKTKLAADIFDLVTAYQEETGLNITDITLQWEHVPATLTTDESVRPSGIVVVVELP